MDVEDQMPVADKPVVHVDMVRQRDHPVHPQLAAGAKDRNMKLRLRSVAYPEMEPLPCRRVHLRMGGICGQTVRKPQPGLTDGIEGHRVNLPREAHLVKGVQTASPEVDRNPGLALDPAG